MFAVSFPPTGCNRLGEVCKGIILMNLATRCFDELREPFNQIEIRTIGPQKEHRDVQPFDFGHDKRIALIFGITQEDRDGSSREFFGHVW